MLVKKHRLEVLTNPTERIFISFKRYSSNIYYKVRCKYCKLTKGCISDCYLGKGGTILLDYIYIPDKEEIDITPALS